MKPFYIYFILNKLTGKYYVGQTVRTPEIRWKSHISDALIKRFKKNYFHSALRYYGVENFEVRTLFICYDRKTLNESEVYFIDLFKANEPSFGYNGTSGGESPRMTEETRAKMSLAGKGKKQSPEHIRKRAAAITGKKRPSDVVDKSNRSRKGKKTKPHSQSTKDKMRIAATNRRHTEGTREKMRKPHTLERIANIRESLRIRRERLEKEKQA